MSSHLLAKELVENVSKLSSIPEKGEWKCTSISLFLCVQKSFSSTMNYECAICIPIGQAMVVELAIEKLKDREGTERKMSLFTQRNNLKQEFVENLIESLRFL